MSIEDGVSVLLIDDDLEETHHKFDDLVFGLHREKGATEWEVFDAGPRDRVVAYLAQLASRSAKCGENMTDYKIVPQNPQPKEL